MKDYQTTELEYEYYQFKLNSRGRRSVKERKHYSTAKSPIHSPGVWQADAMDTICDHRSLANKAFSQIQSVALKYGALKHD